MRRCRAQVASLLIQSVGHKPSWTSGYLGGWSSVPLLIFISQKITLYPAHIYLVHKLCHCNPELLILVLYSGRCYCDVHVTTIQEAIKRVQEAMKEYVPVLHSDRFLQAANHRLHSSPFETHVCVKDAAVCTVSPDMMCSTRITPYLTCFNSPGNVLES